MTDPRFVGPDIPGYVQVSNHTEATSEEEAIALGAKFLDVPAESVRAIRFQPLGTPYWIWSSYVDEKYSGRVALRIEYVKVLLGALNEKAKAEDAEDWRRWINPS